MKLPLLFLIASIASCNAAFGAVSAWLPFDRQNEWRLIENMRPEVALRIELIRLAEQSIDITVYDQRCDQELTLPVLGALRDAANRGVKVRFVVSWAGQEWYDRCGALSTHRYLTEKPTRTPIEYVIFGGPQLKERGWSMFDAVHEKLFIIDGKWAITGGRPFGTSYLTWIDTGFLVKGPLAGELQIAFDRVWSAVRSQAEPLKSGRAQAEPPRYSLDQSGFSEGDSKVVRDSLEWLLQPASGDAVANSGPGSPRVRVLHHEFVRQLAEFGAKRRQLLRIGHRMTFFDDPVVDAVVERLRTARTVCMNLLTFELHPKLKQALLDAKARDVDIRLLTNLSANPNVARDPRGYIYLAALPDLLDVIKAGIPVYEFQPARGATYLHRKLAIIDDVVFTGSHNFNAPSTFNNDEMTLEIEDPAMAAEYREVLFDRVVVWNAKRPELRKVEHDYNGHKMVLPLLNPLLRLM